jgi:tripartite-type tricarboxylate transporter receptor subunit TctC
MQERAMRSDAKRREIRPRRSAIAGAVVAALALSGAMAGAYAQTAFPRQPIHIVVGFAAGGPTDILARVVGAKVGETLGQQVVIENRTGASGNIASEAVAHAPNDGHTLLMAPLVFAVNESLFPGRRFAYDKDFTAVAPLAETANVLVVHPSLDVTSVQGLIAAARARPGKILYATAGKGTATHLAGELFGMMAAVKMTPVHYRGGGDLVKDLLSGEIKVTFSTIPPVLDFIQKGTLRGIATTALHRDPALPDLATIAEAGLPGYDVRLWLGLLAPAGTPPEVVGKLSMACAEALKSEDVKSVLVAQGFDPLNGTPAAFDAFVRSEIAKWGDVVKKIGLDR